MTLLEIRNLKMYYQLGNSLVRAVDDVSFTLDSGETLGLIGESGCGKSSLAFTIVRVLPPNSKIFGGQILYEGKDLLKMSDDELRQLRGAEISNICQNSMSALNPVLKVGNMAMETISAHENIPRDKAKLRVENLFVDVGLEKSRMNNYPHEFSGGMKQRAIIATSLICYPKIIIADEPTTAFDVIVQEQILQKIKELQNKFGLAMLLISHDISIVAETCERMAVMYAGRLVEVGRTVDLFTKPHHPYTLALLRSFPSIIGEIKKLSSIPGKPPNLINPSKGCRFSPRCWIHNKLCDELKYEMIKVEEEHYTSCPFALNNDLIELFDENMEKKN